jgi:voltage-gated potassium channel
LRRRAAVNRSGDNSVAEAQVQTRKHWRLLDDLERWLETPMVVLSLAWLAIAIFELSGHSSDLLVFVGTAIWIVFIAEFLVRWAIAPAKGVFLKRNWLTILALLVPALRLLRAFAIVRAAPVLRGARLVRVVGSVNRSMNALRKTLRRRGFGYVLALTIVVLLSGAAGMLSFEPARGVQGGFTSYGHALWWTGMLIASIGTDFWPQSMEGRLLSSLLALYGLAVFGYLTATLASFFIDRDAGTRGGAIAGSGEVERLRREIAALRMALQASG